MFPKPRKRFPRAPEGVRFKPVHFHADGVHECILLIFYRVPDATGALHCELAQSLLVFPGDAPAVIRQYSLVF